MENSMGQTTELLCIIVNHGMASDVLQAAKKNGVTGGTIMYGRGTIRNKILNFLGLADIRKEIIYIVAEAEKVYPLMEKLNAQFSFQKPNHGIAFTRTLCSVFGASQIVCYNSLMQREAGEVMYHQISVIVDKGKAEEVIEAAVRAGSKGGTIINGRGSGIHETSKVFAMDIEPEKEIVIILSEVEATEGIVEAIRETLHIDDPGKGIMYVQNVNRTYGIYR